MAEESQLELVGVPKETTTGIIVHEAKIPKWDMSDGTSEHAPKAKTLNQLVDELKTNETTDIEARVYGVKEGYAKPFILNKSQFLEAVDRNEKVSHFRESVDFFGTDTGPGGFGGPSGIGHDFTPLLGGPFNKQLYIHDYLEMIANCFYALNHDPILRTCIDIIVNFVLGRGFRVDCKNPDGLILWRAFEKVNKRPQRIRTQFRELLTYGETMTWWLPDGKTQIRYEVPPEQASPKGLIPRIRTVDPSTIWDIITMPEDIETKIAYVQNFPTQYQIYTGQLNGANVPSTKYIFQQIPAHQIDHYKINCMSNEKRGRSALFPVLGYAKRLRDSVNYQIIALQKQAAWSEDVEIDGNQQDLNNYAAQIAQQGQFAPPGSAFVHSTKVKRTYLSNAAGRGQGQGDAQTACLDMIAAGMGIPVSWLGLAHATGSTRAGALIGTEPSTKKMEEYQNVIEGMLHDEADRLFKMFGIDAEIEVTFPELYAQDRTAKLKDIALAESEGWITQERAATMGAKELSITEYDWETEKASIEQERHDPNQAYFAPLTAPPGAGPLIPGMPPGAPQPTAATSPAKDNPNPPRAGDAQGGVTSGEKRDIKRVATT